MRIVFDRGLRIAVVISLFAVPLHAQLASDEVPHQRTLPISDEIRQALEDSRFRFGILRLQPQFQVRDFGYDNNVLGSITNKVADWHSTVSAGTNFIVPLGSKMYFRGTVMPQYTWYRKVTALRNFGGDYGASLLGLYNHLTVEAAGSVFKGVNVVNSEVNTSAPSTRLDGSGTAELNLIGRVSVFGVAHAQRQRYSLGAAEQTTGIDLSQLQRNEAVLRGGLRYRLTSFFDVSAAVERTKTDFLIATDRNNQSDAVLLGVRYDVPRSFIDLSIGERRGQAQSTFATVFPQYRTTTGSYYASHELASRILVDIYGHRGVVYSLVLNNPYYLETLNGGGITVPIGHRLALRGYGEFGTNAYPIAVDSIKRNDNVTGWGAGFAYRIIRNISLVALASDNRYNSNVPGQSRSIFRVTTSIGYQSELFR